MNTIRYFFLLFVLLSILLVSCQKKFDEFVDDNPGAEEIEGMDDLSANESFDWQTTREIALSIEAMPTPYPIVKTMEISTLEGDVLFKAAMKINVDYQSKITVPALCEELIVIYGEKLETVPILQDELFFSFIPDTIK